MTRVGLRWNEVGMVQRATLVLLAMLCACDDGKPRSSTARDTLPPQVVLYGVRVNAFNTDGLVAQGRAAKVTYDRISSGFEASEALMRFLPRNEKARAKGDQGFQLRAPVVKGSLATQVAEGEGGITLRGDRGLRGKTERGQFDGKTMKARGQTPTVIQGPGYDMHSSGFEFDFNTEEFLFTGGVESQLGRKGAKR